MRTTADLSSQPQRSTQPGFRSIGIVIALVIAGVGLAMVAWGVGTYNGLVRSDQEVRSRWAQVENAYQRRADLIPNLVETVKGAANFEKSTFTQVTEARAKVGQLSAQDLGRALDDPATFQKFEAAQQSLGASLQRLLVVTENYPDLKATANFRDLQAQLEGTENRISVERMRFNEASRDFNSMRSGFPAVLVASAFGKRFSEKPYFQAQQGAQTAPRVDF